MKNMALVILTLLTAYIVKAETESLSFLDQTAKLVNAAKDQNQKSFLFQADGVIFLKDGKMIPHLYNISVADPKNLITYNVLSYVNGGEIYFQEEHFVPGWCGGIGCQPPPNKPEPLANHPAIKDWKADFAQIKLALKKAGMEADEETIIIFTVATKARLEKMGILDRAADEVSKAVIDKLKNVKDNAAIIRLSTNHYPERKYLLLDAKSGQILQQGEYRQLPPVPGAVSSGG